MHNRPCAAGLILIGLLTVSACVAAPASPAPTSSDAPAGHGSHLPAPPDAAVIATGTVMDVDGAVELCLGPIAESYPPQCSGIPMSGWTWDGVDGSEQVDRVRWGAYAVTGQYDGTIFAVTETPVLLALYDSLPHDEQPVAGSKTTDELTRIQGDIASLFASAPGTLLGSVPIDGVLVVDVVWDDGTLQQAADERYGADAVVIRPALREVG